MKERILMILFLLTVFCSASVVAQEKSTDKKSPLAKLLDLKKSRPQNQCELYGKTSFTGENINFKLVNADLQDILGYITEQFGFEFAIDSSVKQLPITVNASEVPWNVVLDEILKSQNLCIQISCPILRVVEMKTPANKEKRVFYANDSVESGLYTEFVKLKTLKLKEIRQGDVLIFDENTSNFIKHLEKLLSPRGSVEVDIRTNTLVITDIKKRKNLIVDYVKLLDDSGFTLEELIKESGFINK